MSEIDTIQEAQDYISKKFAEAPDGLREAWGTINTQLKSFYDQGKKLVINDKGELDLSDLKTTAANLGGDVGNALSKAVNSLFSGEQSNPPSDKEKDGNPITSNMNSMLLALAAGAIAFFAGGELIGLIGALIVAAVAFFVGQAMGLDERSPDGQSASSPQTDGAARSNAGNQPNLLRQSDFDKEGKVTFLLDKDGRILRTADGALTGIDNEFNVLDKRAAFAVTAENIGDGKPLQVTLLSPVTDGKILNGSDSYLTALLSLSHESDIQLPPLKNATLDFDAAAFTKMKQQWQAITGATQNEDKARADAARVPVKDDQQRIEFSVDSNGKRADAGTAQTRISAERQKDGKFLVTQAGVKNADGQFELVNISNENIILPVARDGKQGSYIDLNNADRKVALSDAAGEAVRTRMVRQLFNSSLNEPVVDAVSQNDRVTVVHGGMNAETNGPTVRTFKGKRQGDDIVLDAILEWKNVPDEKGVPQKTVMQTPLAGTIVIKDAIGADGKINLEKIKASKELAESINAINKQSKAQNRGFAINGLPPAQHTPAGDPGLRLTGRTFS